MQDIENFLNSSPKSATNRFILKKNIYQHSILVSATLKWIPWQTLIYEAPLPHNSISHPTFLRHGRTKHQNDDSLAILAPCLKHCTHINSFNLQTNLWSRHCYYLHSGVKAWRKMHVMQFTQRHTRNEWESENSCTNSEHQSQLFLPPC